MQIANISNMNVISDLLKSLPTATDLSQIVDKARQQSKKFDQQDLLTSYNNQLGIYNSFSRSAKQEPVGLNMDLYR